MIENKTLLLKSSFISCKYLSLRCAASSSFSTFIHLQCPAVEKSQVHGLDIVSLNYAIARFSKAGDLDHARHLFDGMLQRDVISWNSMMSAYVQRSQPDEALDLFVEMRRHDLKPTPTSFSVALSACGKLCSLNHGELIHCLSIKNGSFKNVFVGTSLISMYSKCKKPYHLMHVFHCIDYPNLTAHNALISGLVANRRIDDAHKVFKKMSAHNVISWTALISGYIEIKKVRSAYELFNAMPGKNSVTWAVMLGGFVNDKQFEKAIEFFTEMRNSGVQPTTASVVSVITACSNSKNIEQGQKIQGYVIKVGYNSDGVIEALLVFMYIKCLNIEDAQLEFNKMESTFIGSWNYLLQGYIANGQVDEARSLFDERNEKNHVSWNLMINAYLGSSRIDDAIELFMKIPDPSIEAVTALMSAYIELGKIEDAKRLFNDLPKRDVVAYTTLISGYMKAGLLDDAWELFNTMPNRSVVTYNVMISGLVQHGKVVEAYQLFNEAPEHDEISWSAMIMGHAQSGSNDEAFLLFRRMILSDISPSETVISSILTLCANLSMLSQGEQIHTSVIKLGFGSCLLMSNSLINMYGKCGDMPKARIIFDNIPEHDLVTWNSIIYAYAVNGLTADAIKIFEDMKTTGVKPDHVTFLGILTACTHRGLIEQSWSYFNSMKYDYGIIPTLAHHACVIDLHCRMGLVEKAEELISLMPFQPDSAIWTSLLCGCKLNKNVEIAQQAASQLLALNGRDPMPYLHLIRMYWLAGRLTDMDILREKMNRLGLNKRPGCSWIEINGEFNSFFAGDMSYSSYTEVRTNLCKIVSEIRKLGYTPNYSLVMEDMEDQEKEEILMQHSEKLALSFGLLRTAPFKSLRIMKNLRVCMDCHSAFKLISLSSKREIVMRDAVRFHHFKGGSCSCSDYW